MIGDGIVELLAGYRPLPGHYDELIGADGQPREYWRELLADFAAMGPALRQSVDKSAASLLREHDVAYIAGNGGSKRPWHLDIFPLLLQPDDWATLSSGLVQRARLLNAIVGDLYGPQQLLKTRRIPAPIVFGNPEFMPGASGGKARDGEFLHFLAFDLGRAQDGKWWVISQRTESPAGIGYALENRLVTSRSIPEQFNAYNLHRLAGFFRAFADHFARLGDQHRSVVLTGGPEQQDYFEHALIGRYLGYPVVESADLTVRDGRVFMKTLEGLERVDLIIRRIPSEHSDPLELRAPPGLGIAGLLHAARSGNVVLANAIGSGVGESVALHPFLESLSQELLGEPLALPGVPAWWCGDPDGRAHVIEHADELVLRHAFQPRHLLAAGAWEYARSDKDLRDRAALETVLEMRPQDVVGIERMKFSTVPYLTGDATLRPVPMVLRVYVAATDDGYQVMPGGLIKVSGQDLGTGVHASKDVWVLAHEKIEPDTLLRPLRAATLKRSDRDLASKTADDLFWLGRYLERADGSVRLFRSLFLHLAGEAAFGNVPVALDILTGLMVSLGQVAQRHSRRLLAAGYRGIEHEIWNVLFDPESPDSPANVLANVARTADQVRERLSPDAWRIIERLTSLPRLRFRGNSVSDAVHVLNELVDAQSAINGLVHENMTRGYGWRFLDMGRRIERARYIVRVMRELLLRVDRETPGVLGMQLELADSHITYRSRYKTGPQLPAVLDLVLADDSNPRSLVFQLAEMKEHMGVMPLEGLGGHLSEAQRTLIAIHTDVVLADVDKLAMVTSRKGSRTHLDRLLKRCEKGLARLTVLITETYFSHAIGHRVTGNVLRSSPDDAV
jgi:uncharacterized circularly permuted ATP-grasp superfamily protein/uncharacterized alpha-E superfamily protein